MRDALLAQRSANAWREHREALSEALTTCGARASFPWNESEETPQSTPQSTPHINLLPHSPIKPRITSRAIIRGSNRDVYSLSSFPIASRGCRHLTLDAGNTTKSEQTEYIPLDSLENITVRISIHQLQQSTKQRQSKMSDQATKDAAARQRIISHMNNDHHDSVLAITTLLLLQGDHDPLNMTPGYSIHGELPQTVIMERLSCQNRRHHPGQVDIFLRRQDICHPVQSANDLVP